MTISQTLARFICGLDVSGLPDEVVQKTRCCYFNGYGIGINGFATAYEPVARQSALSIHGVQSEGATLLASGETTAPGGAALANAALFHGRAQEDTCGAAHFGAVLIPLLTALVESRKADQSRLSIALVAGYEAGGVFEELLARQTTPRGFRASTLYGTIAAAAACAKLFDLDETQTAAALSNATSCTGGLLQSFSEGTDEWRYQVGVVANTGWMAAELARAGSVSGIEPFEGDKGLANAFAQTLDPLIGIEAKFGRDWQTLRVAFKPFPVCAFNQTPVNAALKLRDTLAGRDIRAARVFMNPYECGYAGMDATGPFNSISGTLMSIPFCIATTLVHGTPSMGRMTDYGDRAVNDLEARISLIADESVETLCCRIEADLEGGTTEQVDLKLTARDYAFDWSDLGGRLRQMGAQEGVPTVAFDKLEAFSADPDRADLSLVLDAFALAREAR